MAVTVGPGGGGALASKDIATDLVTATEYQVVKLAVGAAGSATLISNAAPIPTSPQGTVTVAWSGQTVAATQSGAWTVAQGTAAASSGAWPTKIVDSAGTNVAAVSAAGAVKVDGSAVTQPVSGTVAVSGTVTVDSELPAAAALTDAFANPTAPGVASFSMGWNGTTWDRLKSTTANGLVVDVSRVQGNVTVAQATAANLNATVTAASAFPVTDNGGSLTVDNAGTFAVQSTLQTGANLAGRVNPEPQTANGLSISRVISAATTNATSVKASAGQVYSIYATNVNAAARFLKLYNKASAPTVGTDTPVLTFAIPGNAAGAGFSFDTGGMGVAFGTGIALAITAAVTDADTTAVAANEIVVNLLYK